MKVLLTALQFLTIIPVGRRRSLSAADLASSMAVFPAVGLILGGSLVLLDRIAQGILPLEVRSLLILVFLSAATGAGHLDGFADTVDGIAGGWTRRERLRIMRDSRIGAAGAVALILLLLMKYLCIAGLHGAGRNAGLAVMPCAGRWTMVIMAFMGPYARRKGLGRAFFEHITYRSLGIATAIAGLGAGVLMGVKGLILIAMVCVLSILAVVFLRHRLGGVTGDTMGALNEMAELLFLLGTLGLK